jgi:radical SAM/Cys-rich protein
MIPDFKETVYRMNSTIINFEKLLTLQVNLGNRCNQSCEHCHLAAGPAGKNVMSLEVMEKIVSFLRNHRGLILDITGGCPELHPQFKWFLGKVHGLVSSLMVRTNLTVLTAPGMEWIPTLYKKLGVVLMASLPCYTEDTVNKQRGEGVFNKSVDALKKLNKLGYGSSFELNLIYNPASDFLPPSQVQLEEDYRRQLFERYGITFNRLYTIINAPLGRFKDFLESCGRLTGYFALLVENFNPEAAKNIMCRTLINVDWRGVLYNCDFNQASGLPLRARNGTVMTIDTITDVLEGGCEIVTGNHCYCCTAGVGSSCTGALV